MVVYFNFPYFISEKLNYVYNYIKFFSSKEQIWNVIQNLPDSDKICHIQVRLNFFFLFFFFFRITNVKSQSNIMILRPFSVSNFLIGRTINRSTIWLAHKVNEACRYLAMWQTIHHKSGEPLFSKSPVNDIVQVNRKHGNCIISVFAKVRNRQFSSESDELDPSFI